MGSVGFQAVLEAEASRQPPFTNQHRAGDDIAGIDRHYRANVVVAQQFNGSLGAAMGAGHEHDAVTALERGPDIGNPVGNTAVERRHRLHRQLLP